MPLEIRKSGNYIRQRIKNPNHFVSDSFKTKNSGKHRIIFGCEKGNYDIKTKLCKIPLQVQAVLHPSSEYEKFCKLGRCPVLRKL